VLIAGFGFVAVMIVLLIISVVLDYT